MAEIDDQGDFTIRDWQPWVYASLSILVLSLVGLLGILLVPIVNRVLYNHLLQFLVAMAAGSLAGDALMHLLPEALGLHSHSHYFHNSSNDFHHSLNGSHPLQDHHESDSTKRNAIWKCCVAFVGIYGFFLIERVMGIFREYNRRREESSISLTKRKSDSGVHSHCHTHVVGFKLSGTTANQCIVPCDAHNGSANNMGVDEIVAMESLLPSDKKIDLNKRDTNSYNHHSHSHSGVESNAPDSIASVAWMVILGDGIHNLIDGLTVGVAYRTVSGGLSTSLAVLMHEIPHELGDFAVLLKSGMSVRLAVVYNIVSSVISFIGMVIGVFVGHSHEATSSWIFALAAGGFLYIALVDLLPELRPLEARRDESPLWHLALQNLGLLTGVGIMVLIAIYESDIEHAFSI